MGECFIVRRGGQVYQLPVLDSSYPQNVTVVAAASRSATFAVQISQPGTPAEYTYQWYKNGSAISGATGASVTLSGLTAAASHTVYCVVANKAGTVTSRVATLTVKDWKPAYTYTGSSTLIDDGNYNWRIKFLSSGTLTFSSLGNGNSIDMFCVGGGGGGAYLAGGGGGYTSTSLSTLNVGTAYTITVGAGGAGSSGGGVAGTGGTSSFHSIVSAAGGVKGVHNGKAGDGGSGGSTKASTGYTVQGGKDGANGGGDDSSKIGIGQHTTTREFGESTGTLYSTGGDCLNNYYTGADYPRNPNTGDGGNGSGTVSSGGAPPSGGGGSGIVIIRNHR